MRYIVTFIIIVFMSMDMDSHPISQEEAQNFAADFFKMNCSVYKAPRKAIGINCPESQSANNRHYYIFNAPDDNGFVIIAGDSRVRRILGYSDRGAFSPNTIPPQLEWLLIEYQKLIESLPSNTPEYNRPVSRSEAESHLLSTQWGQGYPYNTKCPVFDGIYAQTGCVATAMAQVINFEKKSNHVPMIPEYHASMYMHALPEHDFDLGNLDDEGIATLMLYCGQSVRTDYGLQESGADVNAIPGALRDYFGWEQSVSVKERSRYDDDQWKQMVKDELSAGHPIIYSAISDTKGGHAFVVDGISDDLYHVNWGWDGYMDGYFSFQPFSTENKSDFINNQSMVTIMDTESTGESCTTVIDGIYYQLNRNLTATVLPSRARGRYVGDLVIPSHVEYEGKTYTVNHFGEKAFNNCSKLESISIPASITGQENSIFEGCVNLHKVYIEDLTAFIKLDIGYYETGSPFYEGADLFLNGELVKDLVIPEGTEEVGFCKFSRCTSIENVIMPSTVKVIGNGCFVYCPNLKYVDLSKTSIEKIGPNTFLGTESLEEIRLPSTLKAMGSNAIGEELSYGKLRKIVSFATTPPFGYDGNVFSGQQYCDAVVYVPDESVEKYRHAKDWSDFSEICPLSEERPIPETSVVIYKGLKYEINLTDKYAKVIGYTDDIHGYGRTDIPYSVEYEGLDYPVEEIGYEGLDGIYIGRMEAPLRKIGIRSFISANFRDRLELPAAIDKVPDQAFRFAKIPHLILSENIKSIGHWAFGDYVWGLGSKYTRIGDLECRGSQPPVISDDTFDSLIYADVTLKVPSGCRKVYANADGWRNFQKIINIGDIQDQLFDNDLMLSASIKNNIPVRDRMPIVVEANVKNSGEREITGFLLSWFVDGKNLGEKRYDVELKREEKFSFEETITMTFDHSGTHELKLVISIIGVEDQDNSDNVVILPIESFDNGFYRVSLIEQFASEKCSLSPSASMRLFETIYESGCSDFVGHVTHHCGFYDDFLTLNHDYNWFFGDQYTFTPAVMINRSDVYETNLSPINEMTDDLRIIIDNEAALCNALVSVDCDIVDDRICVKTVLEKDDEFDIAAGYDYLTVFIVEDSIPAVAQVGVIGDGQFMHRNTVRRILSGVWGDKIEWDDDICALKYESDINDSWNRENLKALAFIHRYDPTSPLNCQVYTAGSSIMPYLGTEVDDSSFKDPASLMNIVETSKTHDIYTIMGVKVKANSEDFQGLPPGIYISDGKKIYVR